MKVKRKFTSFGNRKDHSDNLNKLLSFENESDDESDICLSDTFSYDELDEIDTFKPVQSRQKEKIMRYCQRQLTGDYMNIGTCAVCDKTIDE